MTFNFGFTAIFFLSWALALTGCKTAADNNLKNPVLAYEPVQVKLVGTIRRETFPGKPNYESIAQGDEPEVYWILNLREPVDVAADRTDAMSPAESSVQKIQMVLDANGYEKYRELLNQTVEVEGSLFHQITGHHKTAVLINVNEIEREK